MTGVVLPPDEVDYLRTVGRCRSLEHDEPLCFEGAPPGEVFLVESGAVRMVMTALSGRETLLDTRGPGELVGEFSALDGTPRSASVYADEPTAVVVLTRQGFLDALAARPELARVLLVGLAAKVRAADQRTVGRDSADVTARVVAQLVALSQAFVESHPVGQPIRLVIRQADLAARVGSTRETVARVLGELREGGVLETGRGVICVSGLGRLRSLL